MDWSALRLRIGLRSYAGAVACGLLLCCELEPEPLACALKAAPIEVEAVVGWSEALVVFGEFRTLREFGECSLKFCQRVELLNGARSARREAVKSLRVLPVEVDNHEPVIGHEFRRKRLPGFGLMKDVDDEIPGCGTVADFRFRGRVLGARREEESRECKGKNRPFHRIGIEAPDLPSDNQQLPPVTKRGVIKNGTERRAEADGLRRRRCITQPRVSEERAQPWVWMDEGYSPARAAFFAFPAVQSRPCRAHPLYLTLKTAVDPVFEAGK